MKRIALLFFVLSCLCLPPCAHAAGVYRALLVGCDHFITQQDTDPASANNVQQMSQALQSGSMAFERMLLCPQGLSGPDELEKMICEAFEGADEDDVSFFYISTHGLWNQDQPCEDMTLVLSDSEHESGVTAGEMREMFDRIPGVKVLMLDACHSGAVIGKGVANPCENIFAGSDYKVICSSGGAEESWFWSGSASQQLAAGAGYFSGALVSGLGRGGGFAADDDRDGIVTLSELKRYLRQNHGASTAHVYPEEDDFAVMAYDPQTVSRPQAAITNVVFEQSALSLRQPSVTFSFTVLRDTQVAYQLVSREQGRWDFANATLLWDNAESFGVYGDLPGALSPGYQERTLSMDLSGADLSGGYMLLQIITITRGQIALACSHVLCVPPVQGDPQLLIAAQAEFCPELMEEMHLIVFHNDPCELTVTIEDEAGETVRRLSSRQPSRPEQLLQPGSTFVWNGRAADGSLAPSGAYRVHVKAWVGDTCYEAWSDPFLLLEPEG